MRLSRRYIITKCFNDKCKCKVTIDSTLCPIDILGIHLVYLTILKGYYEN